MHIKRKEPEKQGFNFLVQTFAVDFVPSKVLPELVLFTISVMPMNLLGEFASADIDGHRSIIFTASFCADAEVAHARMVRTRAAAFFIGWLSM